MANLYAYVEIVKSGQKYTGEPPEVHQGESLTGIYRVAPAFSASTATLPSVGATASTDIWAEVLVTTHAQTPAVASPAAGTAVVRKFPFAHNTAGILTGHTVYTPTVGDILLNAWIEVSTAWDGVNPAQADIGTFVGSATGLFNNASPGGLSTVDLTQADDQAGGSTPGLLVGETACDLAGLAAVSAAHRFYRTATGANPVGFTSQTADAFRLGIGKFVTADPVKVVVSQNGTNTGADPASATGSAILYLVTATPV